MITADKQPENFAYSIAAILRKNPLCWLYKLLKAKGTVSPKLLTNIKNSFPSKNGLYPHEILILREAPRYHFPLGDQFDGPDPQACFIVPIDSQANSFILGMCGVFASLASAFFIAFIVRYRDMKEKCQQEEKALAVMRPFLTEICTVINGFLPQINAFMTINDDDTVSYPPERVYYTDINAQEGNRNFVDFNAIFQNAGTRLSDAIEKAIKSPVIFQCNKTVANLLTNIQLNGFTNNLYEIQGTRSVFDQSSTVYMDIKKAYLEFVDLYAELVKLADYGIDPKLRVLTNVEKTEYIKEIQTIAPQLPTEKGTVYLGCKRIR